MFHYLAYGLHIESSLALPELIAASQAEPEVSIQYGGLGHEIPPELGMITCLSAATSEVYLSWGRAATLLIRDGRTIIVDPFPGVDERVLRLFVLGAGLGVLLHQRRLLVLHASAVAVEGQVVAFIGDKGWGKSTTAAALHARGHQLMTDDLVAIYIDDDGRPMVLPGYPQVKLWPQAIAALGNDPETMPQIRDEIQKRVQNMAEDFPRTAMPLAAIYALGGGKQFSIDSLPPQIAVMLLVRHLYVTRFGDSYSQSVGGQAHLLQCADLARRSPVRLLKRPFDLTALNQLTELIEDDVTQIMRTPI